MSTDTPKRETVADESTNATDGAATAELEVLRAENERLRRQFKQAKRTTYRRTSLAFLVVGVLAFASAVVFPNARETLVVFGATGIFGAVLTYFITPEAFHAATVSEHIYAATEKNATAMIEDLGLQDRRLYVPVGETDVKVYVPAHLEFTVPPERALESLFVVTGDERERGIALHPTGLELYDEFQTAATLTDDVALVANQLATAVVEQFELADSVGTTALPEENEARYEIDGSSCGQPTSFDQPIVSLLATGLARHTGEPVRLDLPDEGADGPVRFVWGERVTD